MFDIVSKTDNAAEVTLIVLPGPQMLVFVYRSIITPSFIGLRKYLVIGQLKQISVFSAFHWSTSDTPSASQCITVQLPISKTQCGPCIAGLGLFVS